MLTFSSTMPRLFGRAPTPTPAAASIPAAASPAASSSAPPRSKLVRKSHMTMASSAAPLAPGPSLTSRVSMASMGSLGSLGSLSAMPPLSPTSSVSFGRAGPGPGQGLLLETHREGSFASTSASAYEGLLHDHDRSSLYSRGSGQHPHPYPQAHPQAHPHPQTHARHSHYTVRSQRHVHRAWLSAADARQSSWSGERPPPRKLVKDPNGSARPAASRELVDVDEGELQHGVAAGGESGSARDKTSTPGTLGLRRKMARWRDLRW